MIVVNGNTVSISISSWLEVIFLFYFVLEMFSIYNTRMSIIHKLIISPYIIYQINKIIPNHWKIRNIWWILATKRKSLNRFDIYLELMSKIKTTNKVFIKPLVSDTIQINRIGKITYTNIKKLIDERDNIFSDEVKQFNRNYNLQKLGIKE